MPGKDHTARIEKKGLTEQNTENTGDNTNSGTETGRCQQWRKSEGEKK